MNYGHRFVTLYRRQGSRQSQRKKRQKANWLSEQALQIAVKIRETKSKGEKERYSNLNAEFQKIARRDKKAFLSNQCKEMRKTTEWERLAISSRKLEIPREHFMQRWAGSIKNRNGRDLIEPKILRRGGKNTQKNCTKKIFTTWIITMV